jgi:hypothetical protein
MAEVHKNGTEWQSSFLCLLPEISRRLSARFRWLNAEAKEEAVSEALLHAVRAYTRLWKQGRSDLANAGTLAMYAARQTLSGRPAAGQAKRNDILSRLGRVQHQLQIHECSSGWVDAITDSSQASIPDIVATRIDFRSWFKTLSRDMRRIAGDLALGHGTAALARKYNVSASRISQHRRALHESWERFRSDTETAVG